MIHFLDRCKPITTERLYLRSWTVEDMQGYILFGTDPDVMAAEQYKHVDMARELQEHNGAEGDLEADYQAASDHLNLVQTALRQQEKIERYEADLDELQIRLEEQNEVVAE